MKFFTDDKFDEVIHVLETRGWQRVDDVSEANLVWTNLKNVDFNNDHLHEVIVNHFKGSQHLSNKAFLTYHLQQSNLDFLPVTWSPAFLNVSELLEQLLRYSIASCCANTTTTTPINFTTDSVQLLKTALTECKHVFQDKSIYELCSQALHFLPNRLPQEDLLKLTSGLQCFSDVWIVKPVGLSCGERIEVTRGFVETLKLAQSFNYKCIVQKYIENPLLVRTRRKFDIRQWILVASLQPLVIYGFSECYLRLSSKEFSLEKAALEDKLVHLCNHAIQKENVEVDYSSTGYLCDTMMTQEEFSMELHQRFGDMSESPHMLFKSKIQDQIKQISIETIKSVRDKLEKSGRAFEWLGLDLMVTEDLLVKLIEVNVSPDISHSTSVTSRLVSAAVQDTIHLVLEELPSLGFSARREANNEEEIDTSPRWELWCQEESPLSGNKSKAVPFRPDCKPLFASSADKVLQTLLKLQLQPTQLLNEDDDDDEI